MTLCMLRLINNDDCIIYIEMYYIYSLFNLTLESSVAGAYIKVCGKRALIKHLDQPTLSVTSLVS